MANAILLQSGLLRDFQPLGADGNPVYQSAPQLRAAIRRTLGEDVADIFAIPQRSEDGSRIDWYAPHGGAVVPWSSATPEEQRQAKQQLQDVCKRIQETSRLMQAEHDSERQVFGRLLKYVTRVPGDGHVHLVDGRPVLTFWGFHEHGAPSDHDALMLLPVMEPVAAAVAPSSTATVQVNSESRRRFGWWWLLLPLLLLLLLLLAFLLMRSCAPGTLSGLGLPDLGMPDLGGPDHELTTEQGSTVEDARSPAARDGIESDVGDTTGADTALPELPEGGMPPAAESPEETSEGPSTGADEMLPDEPAPEELPAGEEGNDEQPANEPPGEDQPIDERPNEVSPDTVPPDGQAADDQVPTGSGPTAPPVQQDSREPLVIPPEAVEQGSTDFLNGRWSADSGLMDRTGRPVEVEYEFKQGEGVARYRRSNGVVCEGPTSAAMDGSQLVITDSDNIVCQDGVRFRKSRVECEIGGNGLADCSGSYATGDRFSVGMNKAKK